MDSRLSCSMITRLPAVFVLGLLTACGTGATGIGGGGGGSVSDSLHIVTGLTGVVQTSGSITVDSTVFAGDQDATLPGLRARGFLTFDLSTIPAGKTIRTAKLKVIQSAVTGSPFSDLGTLVVDHLVFGNTLDSADFGQSALGSAFATLSDSAGLGNRLANVFQQVKADLQAGRTVSQFRVRFSLRDGDTDAINDNVKLNDIDDDPSPIIILTFNE